MCGIAGILERSAQRQPETAEMRRMLQSMVHRGPDDEGMIAEGPVILGNRRLSIIDIDGGRQPIPNEDRTIWLVHNGEIYNYQELRRDLARHHTFRTHSDSEVILHLYEDLGERCVDELNGMFGFAIWDGREKRLFLARDRLGIKPLYWTMDDERLAFASEIKALVAAGAVSPEMDRDSLEQYLTFQFCLQARTLVKGVHKLEPGHTLSFRFGRDSEPVIRRYWEFDYKIDTHHTEEFFSEHLLMLLQDSVRLRLRSDVPVGAYLSGGMDSSTVACLGSPSYGGTFHTFTGLFAEGPGYDESPFARAVARHIGAEHHEVVPTAAQFAESLPWLVYMMDEPAAGPGLFPQFCVSRLASEKVKVVLGGQGGDELFGGYARYLAAYLEQCLKGSIYGSQEEGKYVVTWDTIQANLPLLRQYQPLLQGFWRDGLFDDMERRYFRLVSRSDDLQALMHPDLWRAESREKAFEDFKAVFEEPPTKSYFNRMTHFDLKTLLPALLQVEDRASMSASLESRVPLLDHRIVEYVTSMPPNVRFKNGTSKHVFREAVRHLVPTEIFERTDKMGFPVPLGEWFRGEVREFVADTLGSRNARERGVYRREAVDSLIEGEGRFGRQLWGLLCLELWFRAVVDGDRPSAPAWGAVKAAAPGSDEGPGT